MYQWRDPFYTDLSADYNLLDRYYRMFYCDTAIQGNTPALMCAHAFFGPDHMVFATDTPYDDELGGRRLPRDDRRR
jgi:hypothetical protein